MDYRDEMEGSIEKLNINFYKMIESLKIDEGPEDPVINFPSPSFKNVVKNSSNYYEEVLSQSKELKGIPRCAIRLDDSVLRYGESVIHGIRPYSYNETTNNGRAIYHIEDMIKDNCESAIELKIEIPKTRGEEVMSVTKEKSLAVIMNKQISLGFLDYQINLGFLDKPIDFKKQIDLGILDTKMDFSAPLNLGVLDTEISLGVLDKQLDIAGAIRRFCEIQV